MTLSFAIIGSIAATTLKFVNNTRTSERWSFVFKCKKVTNVALSLENKSNITYESLFFIMRLILVRIWRDKLPKYGRAIIKFFLGTVLTAGLGARILSKIL